SASGGRSAEGPPARWFSTPRAGTHPATVSRSNSETQVRFHLGTWDRSRPLVIDPAVLEYCGYIGGAALDEASDIAVDGSGAAYVTGKTDSDENSFPVHICPDSTYNGGTFDAFVAKVSPDGTGLEYGGYIGGSGDDGAFRVAVSQSDEAFVVGYTYSNQ